MNICRYEGNIYIEKITNQTNIKGWNWEKQSTKKTMQNKTKQIEIKIHID